jgi:hypothetical protein
MQDLRLNCGNPNGRARNTITGSNGKIGMAGLGKKSGRERKIPNRRPVGDSQQN